MDTYKNTIRLHSVFGNIMRRRHVLISLRTPSDEYILSCKDNFYPERIYRLMGGGVKDSETPLEAAVREVQEETSLIINNSKLKPLFEVETFGTYENITYTNTTTVYELNVESIHRLVPGDDVTSFIVLNKQDLKKLIERYNGFSENDWYIESDYKHSWIDYGKMYGYIHSLLLEYNI